MIGSANAQYVSCCTSHSTRFDKIGLWQSYLSNKDGTDLSVGFVLPLPTNRGGLKLYITDVKIPVRAAGVADYIDSVVCRVSNDSAAVTPLNDGTNVTSAGDADYNFTAQDCSAYDSVGVNIAWVVGTAGNLKHLPPLVNCYYDA